MTSALELGGDPPCWAHLVEPPRRDLCDTADIEQLVRAFYRRAATDYVLAPIFEAAQVDWSVHIPKLVAFWSWQLLGIRGYEGNPLRAHEPLQAATPFGDEHYARWLELFTETVDEQFFGPTAETAKCRARKMAKALQRLLAGECAAGAVLVEVMAVFGQAEPRRDEPRRDESSH